MPNFHKIVAHRIACLGLYKAFLSHIPHLPFSSTVKKQARSKIRKQFRKDRTIQGLSRIRAALTSAYEHESLFRLAATGDPASITALAEKLQEHKALKEHQTAISQATPRPPRTFPPPTPPTHRRSRIKQHLARTDPIVAARRAKAMCDIRRRIPYLVVTSSLPLLRRPGRRQPHRVSMILKKKIKKRQQRDDLANVLEDWIVIAGEEDMWDAQLRNVGLREKDGLEVRYEPEAVKAWRVVKTRMRDMEIRSMELGARLREIIEKERKEKEAKKREYRREKRHRRRARQQKEVEGDTS